jgi:hypothetical protein
LTPWNILPSEMYRFKEDSARKPKSPADLQSGFLVGPWRRRDRATKHLWRNNIHIFQ